VDVRSSFRHDACFDLAMKALRSTLLLIVRTVREVRGKNLERRTTI
jgi:hypothetical protein